MRITVVCGLVLFWGCGVDGGPVQPAAPDGGPQDLRQEHAPDATVAVDAPALPPIAWHGCDISTFAPGYPPPAQGVRCATIEVPRDPDRPDGETFALRVARGQAARQPAPALFFLAGGPGGSAVEVSGVIPWLLDGLAERFDMVFVDQRGTGGSGYLGCDRDFTADDWKACGAQHADEGLDAYLTVHAAHDIEAVRRRLGYDQVFLFGLSYGTRVALEFLRQHEASAAAVVLDGVVPPDVDFLGQMMQNTDLGVELLVAECEASASCRAVSPRLAEDLETWLTRVREHPRLIHVDGETQAEDESVFRWALEGLLQRRQWRYRVPRAIHQAVEGKVSLWNVLLSEVTGVKITSPAGGLGPSYVAPGLYMTIFCAEFLPTGDLDQLEQIWEGVHWGTGRDLALVEVCEGWAVAAAPPDQRLAVSSAVPALLLSGELDLQTIPEWGDRAAATLSRGTHLRVPYTAHETVKNTCVAQIITDFLLADGAIEAVDTSCLAAIEPDRW